MTACRKIQLPHFIATTNISAVKRSTINLGELTPSDKRSDELTIHYTELSRLAGAEITYSDLIGQLSQGNVVLSVDFAAETSAKRPAVSTWMRGNIGDYMQELQLKDKNGRYITEGAFPLVVCPDAQKSTIYNVVVGSDSVLRNIKITDAYAYPIFPEKHGKNVKTELRISYRIDGAYVLPGFVARLADFKAQLCFNRLGKFCTTAYSEKETATTGELAITLSRDICGTQDIYINGVRVAEITIPPHLADRLVNGCAISLPFTNC